MKRLHYILSFLFIASVALAASVGDDTFIIGKPGSTGNKEIKFRGSPRSIRDNPTSGKLEFTQDGSTFKEIGSGSGNGGGGDNFLGSLNAGFEDGTDSWIATGSQVFTVVTVDQIGDSTSLQSATFDTGGAAILRSALVPVPLGATNSRCSADFKYQWVGGTPASATATIVDQTDALVAQFPAFVATTGTEVRTLVSPIFDCNLGDSLQVKIEFTADEPLMKLDSFFLGSGKNQFQISQATEYAKANWTSNANCSWLTFSPIGSNFFLFDAVDNDCNDPVVSGAAEIPSTKIPLLRVPVLPPGHYRFVARGTFLNIGASSSTGVWTTYLNGTIGGGRKHHYATNLDQGVGSLEGAITITETQTNASFGILVQGSGGVSSHTIRNSEDTQDEDNVEFVLYRYPLNAAEAVTVETTGRYVEAAVGTTSSSTVLSLGTASFAVPTLSSGVIINSGTIPAEVACDGVEGFGDDCDAEGVNEANGISFNAHVGGVWEVCATIQHDYRLGATVGSSINTNWFITRTTVDGTSSLERAVPFAKVFGETDSSDAVLDGGAVRKICGRFDIQPGKQRFVFQYSQSITGAGLAANTLANGGGGVAGTFAQVWTAKPWSENQPTPVFTDLQNSLNAKLGSGQANQTSHVFGFNCSASSTIGFDGGNAIQSVGNIGGGACLVTFQPGAFSTSPVTCLPIRSSAFGLETSVAINGNTIDENSFIIDCKIASTGADCTNISYRVLCVGPE